MPKQLLKQCVLSSVLALLTLTSNFAEAQNSPKLAQSAAQPPIFEMNASNGNRLNLDHYQGKVVMIFHWSTNCAVCLDKMMELRDNTLGWMNRPFVLLAVNHDAKKQDYQDYIRILNNLKSAPAQMQFVHYKDVVRDSMYQNSTALPQTFLVDSQGNLKNTYVGRIPPQAWDQVAELLP